MRTNLWTRNNIGRVDVVVDTTIANAMFPFVCPFGMDKDMDGHTPIYKTKQTTSYSARCNPG